MRALVWNGINRLEVADVPEPRLLNRGDAIVKVIASSTCGSDLHLIDGYVPSMREGAVIGHEFLGEVVEVGPDVTLLRPGDRVVVGSIIGCGGCWYCRRGEWSLCDNSNPNPLATEKAWGYNIAGVFGYSHALGGFPGSHAEYVRVPFAEQGCFPVPPSISYEQAVFLSDAAPTGWMGAELGEVGSGDVVAVWGCGGVGLMAQRAARAMGAERVFAIDRIPERLQLAAAHGAEPLNYEEVTVPEALRELTAGRGPDVCIEAVGMEAHRPGLEGGYDRVKQALRLETGRPGALREAILACRKGGRVSLVGVFGGFVDKFPLGALMNKGLTLRGAQQHGQRYIPRLMEEVEQGRLDPSDLLTHPLFLEQAVSGYELFKSKDDGCIRAVFFPHRPAA